MTVGEAFAVNLRRISKELGIGISELSRKSGVDRTTIYQYFSRHRDPRLITALLIAKALGVTVEELAEGAELL